MRVALALVAAVCREMEADDGPGFAVAAVCGPAFVGTSPTVVRALATACCVLRLFVGVALGLTAIVGESLVALPVVARRIGVAVAEAVVAAEAIWAARGSPLAGAAWELTDVCLRVAMLVGATSVAAVRAVVVATGASAV